jgi:hypothetical protein
VGKVWPLRKETGLDLSRDLKREGGGIIFDGLNLGTSRYGGYGRVCVCVDVYVCVRVCVHVCVCVL